MHNFVIHSRAQRRAGRGPAPGPPAVGVHVIRARTAAVLGALGLGALALARLGLPARVGVGPVAIVTGRPPLGGLGFAALGLASLGRPGIGVPGIRVPGIGVPGIGVRGAPIAAGGPVRRVVSVLGGAERREEGGLQGRVELRARGRVMRCARMSRRLAFILVGLEIRTK